MDDNRIGAVEHHSESPEAQFAHTPGLKVVACSNPVDGYWMIQQAIACDDPVIFLEPKRQYHADKADLDETLAPDPLFTSRVVRQGGDVTVLAYGPTVKTALKAAEALEAEGTPTRVVSVPCMELFRAQPEEYRTQVLPGGPVRVAIEAAVRQPWDWLLMGERGDWKRQDFVGMTGFGASAPADRLYKELGITPEATVAKVKALL